MRSRRSEEEVEEEEERGGEAEGGGGEPAPLPYHGEADALQLALDAAEVAGQVARAARVRGRAGHVREVPAEGFPRDSHGALYTRRPAFVAPSHARWRGCRSPTAGPAA